MSGVIDKDGGYTVLRLGVSLPCHVPVLPGTPDTDAPDEAKTEACAVDAWWNIGGAYPICDLHLRVAFQVLEPDNPDAYAQTVAQMSAQGFGQIPNDHEAAAWATQHRYPHEIESRRQFMRGGRR